MKIKKFSMWIINDESEIEHKFSVFGNSDRSSNAYK